MKRLGLVLLTIALATGCRAVLGIEATEVVDASADGSNDDGTDSATDGGSDGNCAAATQCLKCCRDTYGPAMTLLGELDRDAGCICGGTTCATECATSLCGPNPNAPPAAGCGQCFDPQLRSALHAIVCAVPTAACDNDPACAPATACLRSCSTSGL